jgi:hypothetical protein
MKLKKIIELVLEKNPNFNKDNLVVRADGRIEYDCGHEVGHTVYSPHNDYVHGCDRCCENYTILFPEDLSSQ